MHGLASRPRRARRLGFTILEILIAIVVLVLGITGIIALFPTAIESGNKTIEDSYAAAITQSVVDAIAVGLAESRYTVPAAGRTYSYFIFNHDGVLDAPPERPEDYSFNQQPRRDYMILLPQSKGSEPNTRTMDEPVFLYPVPLPAGSATGGERDLGSLSPAALKDNLADTEWRTTTEGVRVPWISRVFQLGRYRAGAAVYPAGLGAGDIRIEFLGEAIASGGSMVAGDRAIASDPYPSYSFAFTLQRARIDTTGLSGVPDGQITAPPQPDVGGTTFDAYSNSLYELRIMVFRNFDLQTAAALATDTGLPVPRSNVPVREFITLISL